MFYYFVIVNVISFFLYGIDKYLAIKIKRRISEFHLLMFSLVGGSLGSILGMIVFHHKTLKLKFWFINILFLIMYIFTLTFDIF